MQHPLILMAAGVSSRMKKALEQTADSPLQIDPKLIEEANTLPKCMLSVGPNGTRFIDYLLWNAEAAGFQDVIILLNPADTVTQEYVVQSSRRLGLTLKLHFAIQHLAPGREKPWGTGDAIFQALEQFPLEAGEMYTMSNSDNLCSANVFRSAYEAKENTIYSYDPTSLGISPENRVKYGLILTHAATGKMMGNVEKPSLEKIAELEQEYSLSVNMNILTLSYSDTIERLRNLVPHPIRGEKEVTDIFQDLAREGKLVSEIVFETIPDLTSKADIPLVQKYLAEHYPEIQKITQN